MESGEITLNELAELIHAQEGEFVIHVEWEKEGGNGEEEQS